MSGDLDPQKSVSAPGSEVGSDEVPLRPTSIRLDDEARKWLKQEAKRRDVTDSEVVRQALSWYQGWLAAQRGEVSEKDVKGDD